MGDSYNPLQFGGFHAAAGSVDRARFATLCNGSTVSKIAYFREHRRHFNPVCLSISNAQSTPRKEVHNVHSRYPYRFYPGQAARLAKKSFMGPATALQGPDPATAA